MSRKKNETTKRKFEVHTYTVILFDEEEEEGKLFECIPDIWFVDGDLREQCYFPPRTGRSYIQRAINCEKPDDSWSICNCKVVRGGFSTYNSGFKLVKEKCAQRYNTSSAEEKIQAANFRREHPALFGKSIEHIFSKPKSSTVGDSAAETTVNGSETVNQFVSDGVTMIVDESAISENSAMASNNNTISDEASAINHNGSNATNNNKETERRSKAKKRKIEHSKHSVQPSGSRASSSHSSSGKHQQNLRTNSSVTSGLSRRQPDRSHSQQTNKSVESSRRQSSSDQRSSSGSSDQRSSCGSSDRRSSSCTRQLSIRSGSRDQHHTNSRSNSLQTSNLSRQRSNRSSSSSPPMRNSRSRSNVSRRRSTISRSNSPPITNSHSRSNASRRQSCISRSSRPLTRNSRSRSTTVLSSDSSESSHRRLNLQRSRQFDRRDRSGSVQPRSHQSKQISPNGFQNNGKKSANVNVRNHQSSDSKQLMENVKELTKAVKRNNDLLAKNDRRLTRLEVTVNKIFITVGDMNGNNRFQGENDDDAEHRFPDLPIERKRELYKIHQQLKDKEFRKIWLNHERNYCCPTKTSTDTVTMTKYLKRFISLDVRCQLTLKEPGESKLTLYKDYHRVYLFLIDVIKEGYRVCGKRITIDEAHTALRIVWGRSKQLQNNTEKK